MNIKCKSCPKREDCDSSSEGVTGDEVLAEQNQMLNLLLQFEQSICRTINFTLNGRGAGAQWIFFKVMSNKMRDIAKEIEPHLFEAPDSNFDWDSITSIEELSDDFNADSQDENPDWFNGDIKGV